MSDEDHSSGSPLSNHEEPGGVNEQKKAKIQVLWNRAWNRSYIMVFLFISICLASNTFYIDRTKYDGKRITPENTFNLSYYIKKKNSGPCGWISAKFGVYENRTCSESFMVPLRERYGCYLSECGRKKEILCEGKTWTSKEVLTSGCHNKAKPIRHYCCRPRTHLCTWQGIWTSLRTHQNLKCQFKPDAECGKIICDNAEYKILVNSNGSCRTIIVNGKVGEASCGYISFAENSDAWYKKVDGYAVFDSSKYNLGRWSS